MKNVMMKVALVACATAPLIFATSAHAGRDGGCDWSGNDGGSYDRDKRDRDGRNNRWSWKKRSADAGSLIQQGAEQIKTGGSRGKDCDTSNVPELDAAGAPIAFALIGGIAAVAVERRRRRKSK